MGRVEGKIAIVTGASRGIGKAVALRLAEEGAKIVCADVLSCEETVNEIKELGSDAISVEMNVRKFENWENLMEKAHEAFGEVDVLCNIAGIGEAETSILDASIDHIDDVLDINLKGVYYGMKAVIPDMLKKGAGKIINCSSAAGHVGMPGTPTYAAAKGGLMTLTRQVAIEYASKNIQVNSFSPGLTATEIVKCSPELAQALAETTPARRIADPREMGHLCLFLASNESDFITGTDILIDGGLCNQ